jgi:hypothetical protein
VKTTPPRKRRRRAGAARPPSGREAAEDERVRVDDPLEVLSDMPRFFLDEGSATFTTVA